MRLCLLSIFLAFGCAHHPPAARPTIAEEEVAPPPPPEPFVKVVSRRPLHSIFVGRVRATAPNKDFVDAAKEARRKLAKRAEALGADVVKLERVEPSAGGRVVLAGRAYRLP